MNNRDERERPLDFDTITAQAGIRMQVAGSLSTSPAITASTTFTYESIDEIHAALDPEGTGFAYARNANPTVASLEAVLARLDNAEDAVAFGSGMGAVTAAITSLDLLPGNTIVASGSVYGATRAFFAQLAGSGIRTEYIDVLDLEAVGAALSHRNVRAFYCESMTNPLLTVPDIAALVELAQSAGVPTLVDNTFPTPYLFKPLDHGVDIVIHSASKYIAGHGDAMAGIVLGSRSWGQRLRAQRTVTGGLLSPFDAWLTLRGIRTLPLRMERQCATAALLAEWLHQQPWVERVYYPGLPQDRNHDTATRQFNGRYGGMIAVDLGAGREGTLAFIDALSVITAGTSLGDVESLALYPPLASHRALSPEERQEIGIGDSLIRLSIGLESPRDLQRDLADAAVKARLHEAVPV